jgi:hypothetical protein
MTAAVKRTAIYQGVHICRRAVVSQRVDTDRAAVSQGVDIHRAVVFSILPLLVVPQQGPQLEVTL